jgi:hypothetical protein
MPSPWFSASFNHNFDATTVPAIQRKSTNRREAQAGALLRAGG